MCSVYAQSTHTSHVHSVYTQYAIGSTHGQCVHSVYTCDHVQCAQAIHVSTYTYDTPRYMYIHIRSVHGYVHHITV